MSEISRVGIARLTPDKPQHVVFRGQAGTLAQPIAQKAVESGVFKKTLAGIAAAAAAIPIHPKLEKFFLSISKEGAASVYPNEAAVLAGRSAAEAHRTGWIGLQDRFFEEASVAALWLGGVKVMLSLFDKFQSKLFKGLEHLDTNIAWNKPWGKLNQVGTTPQEIFTQNASEAGRFLKRQGARLAFSVGATTGLIAYVVPRLNQWKTEWLIKKFILPKYQQQQNKPEHKAVGMPAKPGPLQPAASFFQPSTNPLDWPASVPSAYSSAYNPMPGFTQPDTQQPALFQGVPTSLPRKQPLQFGLSTGALSAPMNAIGHFIEQTANGNLLAIDIPLTGGRMGTARDRYESIEYGVRDAISLYFYMKFAHHVLAGASKLIDPAFDTVIQLEPKAAAELNRLIDKRLGERLEQWLKKHPGTPETEDVIRKAFKEQGEIPFHLLREVVQGSSQTKLLGSSVRLMDAMRSAAVDGEKGFSALLENELAAYFGQEHQDSALKAKTAVMEALREMTGKTPSNEVDTNHIAKLLEAIKHKQSGFASLELNGHQRSNLSTAIKQAFQHTAGIPVDMKNPTGIPGLKDEAIQAIWNTLQADEQHALRSRVQRMAQADALAQSYPMLQRTLNLLRDHKLPTTEPLIEWVNKAVSQHLTLGELVDGELQTINDGISQLKLDLPANLSGKPAEQQLGIFLEALNKPANKEAQKLLKQIQALQPLVAGQNGQTADKIARENVLQALNTMIEASQNKTPSHLKPLLSRYQSLLTELMGDDNGRLFSLAVSNNDEMLQNKIKEVLLGGLKHDSRVLRKTQEIIGQFTPDMRVYVDPEKTAKQHKIVNDYLDKLMEQAEKKATLNPLKTPFRTIAGDLFKRNRFFRYFAWTIAMGGSMLSLGVLIPKIQNAVTKKLTGRDTHPGINEVFKKYNIDPNGEKAKEQAAQKRNALYFAPPISRNNFQSFKRSTPQAQ